MSFSRQSSLFDYNTSPFHLPLQILVSAHSELFQALDAKKEECKKLQEKLELKDGQIASLEEARKKVEGDNSRCLLSVFSFTSTDKYFSQIFPYCRIARHGARCA